MSNLGEELFGVFETGGRVIIGLVLTVIALACFVTYLVFWS